MIYTERFRYLPTAADPPPEALLKPLRSALEAQPPVDHFAQARELRKILR
jgi:hypothetical protein